MLALQLRFLLVEEQVDDDKLEIELLAALLLRIDRSVILEDGIINDQSYLANHGEQRSEMGVEREDCEGVNG